jgi:Acyltransferase family
MQNSTTADRGLTGRRYDIDWMRTLAMAMLIIYHIVLCFQPWAPYIGFPVNDNTLDELWILMAALNIWRIPVLFMISGMGVCFAMEHRNWKQMLTDRTLRILVPYLFGIVVLQYMVSLLLPVLGWQANFSITFGHLWFLLNIYLYFLWLLGVTIYFKDNPDNAFFGFLSKILNRRFGIFLFALPVMLEALLVNPQYFSTFVDSLHGWLLGFICFFIGFTFVSLKDTFWPAVQKNRWYSLGLAVFLYLIRLFIYKLESQLNWLTGLESFSWMIAAFGFAATYLNKPSRSLNYFSTAVYPVYIIHLPVQFVIAYFLLPQPLSAWLKLLILLSGTFAVCLLLYEFVLRRIKWIRPLFGMKLTVNK